MAKVINRDVPIAEENTTLTGQPATNMYDDWSEEMEDRADNVYDDIRLFKCKYLTYGICPGS